jgi:hypothetical protein
MQLRLTALAVLFCVSFASEPSEPMFAGIRSVGNLPPLEHSHYRFAKTTHHGLRLSFPVYILEGSSEAVYAAISIRSSLLNLLTTGFISADHVPFRVPC